MEHVAQALSQAGCTVEQVEPAGFDFELAERLWGIIVGSEIGAGMPVFARLLTALQSGPTSDSSKSIRHYMRSLLATDMSRHAQALTQRDVLITVFEAFMANWDVWLCPVTSGPAFTHRKMGAPIEIDGHREQYCDATMGHTCIFNITGSPVVVMPIGHTTGGLPLGMQVVGRRWNDMALLATAEALAEAVGAFQRPPGY